MIIIQWTNVNHKYFKVIDTPEKAYWLGFLYADGCIYKRSGTLTLQLCLHEKDVVMIEQFKSDIESSANILYVPNGVGINNSRKLYIYSNEMAEDLVRHGCMTRKTFKIRFPDLQHDLYGHFVRGYFDGDGHVSPRKDRKTPRLHISSNEIFIDELQEFLKQKDITSYKLKNGSIFRIEVSAKQSVINYYNFTYLNATRYMKRKKDVFDKVYANTETV